MSAHRPRGRHVGALDAARLRSVIVHVMVQPERDYYALEKLWSDAALLLHVL